MATQEQNHFVTLWEFLEVKIMKDIQHARLCPTEASIKQIRQRLKEEVLVDIAKAREEYAQLVDKYYREVKPPFNSQDFSQDLGQFIELIGHSIFSGKKFLLDIWAIKFPKDNPKVLAKDLSEYIAVLNDALQDWENFRAKHDLPEEGELYWTYLIRELAR